MIKVDEYWLQCHTKSDPNGCLITPKLYACLAKKSELTPHFAPYLQLFVYNL